MSKKLRIGILFGGRSAEHEVSLQSARNIIEAIDKEKFEVVPIGIDKTGQWHRGDSAALPADTPEPAALRSSAGPSLGLVPGATANRIISSAGDSPLHVDVVFPVLHGPFGEDGTVQGLLKLAGLPFVGSGVLGSAVAMDKDVTKRLLRDAGLPVARFLVLHRHSAVQPDFDTIAEQVGTPFFVKPANLGSSVGIHKVASDSEFRNAVADAFSYDHKILVEEYIRGREIECAVLGNDNPAASVPGEIVPNREFYSYEAKYIDENGAALLIPAGIPPHIAEQVRALSVEAFRVLCCRGMARVDFFLRDSGALLVNEVNTIPGFTRISMYPKLWEATGVSYTELISRLVALAVEQFEADNTLRTGR